MATTATGAVTHKADNNVRGRCHICHRHVDGGCLACGHQPNEWFIRVWAAIVQLSSSLHSFLSEARVHTSWRTLSLTLSERSPLRLSSGLWSSSNDNSNNNDDRGYDPQWFWCRNDDGIPIAQMLLPSDNTSHYTSSTGGMVTSSSYGWIAFDAIALLITYGTPVHLDALYTDGPSLFHYILRAFVIPDGNVVRNLKHIRGSQGEANCVTFTNFLSHILAHGAPIEEHTLNIDEDTVSLQQQQQQQPQVLQWDGLLAEVIRLQSPDFIAEWLCEHGMYDHSHVRSFPLSIYITLIGCT
jgi:hypothetical protein